MSGIKLPEMAKTRAPVAFERCDCAIYKSTCVINGNLELHLHPFDAEEKCIKTAMFPCARTHAKARKRRKCARLRVFTHKGSHVHDSTPIHIQVKNVRALA